MGKLIWHFSQFLMVTICIIMIEKVLTNCYKKVVSKSCFQTSGSLSGTCGYHDVLDESLMDRRVKLVELIIYLVSPLNK